MTLLWENNREVTFPVFVLFVTVPPLCLSANLYWCGFECEHMQSPGPEGLCKGPQRARSGVSCVLMLTFFSTNMLLSTDFHSQTGPTSSCQHRVPGVHSDKSTTQLLSQVCTL